MVTNKNKEQFEKFLVNEIYSENEYHNKEDALSHFYTLKESMQIGVYLAYYDSLDFDVNVERISDLYDITILNSCREILYEKIEINSRNEAYQEAFKKANELINKQLN